MTEAEGPGAAPDPVDQFLRRLAQAQKLTGIETTTQMAELLWLATRLEPEVSQPEPPSEQPQAGESTLDDEDERLGEERDRPPPPQMSAPSVSRPEPSPPQEVDVVAPPTPKALPPEVLPVQVFDPAMLADPLAIIKALKPLLQKIDADIGNRLDEPETVDFMARTDLCIPQLQPNREAWFDLILVVDRSSAAMIIWQRLVQDIVHTLRRYGAFRNVRVFDLVVNPDAQPAEQVMLRSHPQRPEHHPKELIDQRGRRLAIVLSDTTAAHWWQGIVTPTLEAWGRHMPVALWQMLPPWLWQRTALGRGTPISLRNALPGAANQRWQTRASAQDSQTNLQRRIAIPVVTSEAYDLTRWSQLVVGKPGVTPGFVLPPPGGVVPRSAPAEDPNDIEVADRRVQRFLQLASPEAQWLLMLLAAAPVITLPIVRLIREEKLPEVTSPLPIAEVFTSGLLQRLSDQKQQAQKPASSPEQGRPDESINAQDWVQYGFVGKVREALLTGKWVPPVEAIDIINSVSRAIEKRFNRLQYPYTFQAYLKDPTVDLPEGLAGLKAFATITADILESLGRPYAELVQQLRRGAQKVTVPVTELDPYGDRLLTFDYEVAEYLNFPPLEPFDFIEAQLVEDDFPPPLQTEDFTIITLEVGGAPQLSSFDFTIATLHRRPDTGDWIIERQPGRARRFIEPLSNDVTLEMVAIPGGTFLMGSPEGEPEGDRAECPQHEVTVPPFFMGRYPVTQRQYEQVMGTNPAAKFANLFIAPNRPAIGVTRHNAIEFCQRLAQLTERPYRLPSEAEWEYACRAGTKTPFHFGETLTTEVANYNGNFTYANGPKGEYRHAPMPVNHFGIANAFGLGDMHGNVDEWCQDYWHNNYNGAPSDGSARMEGSDDENWILRGGSWFNGPRVCRSASRYLNLPDYPDDGIGFRVCCSPPKT